MNTNVIPLVFFTFGTFVLYYALPHTYRRIALFLFSLLFYLCCDWKMLILLLTTAFFTWRCGAHIEKKGGKKPLLIGCGFLVLLLIYIKYNNFFVPKINTLLAQFGLESPLLKMIMPLGLSYYSFKAISYMIDIYRKKQKAECDFLNYALYLCFFPEILCGPITRYHTFRSALSSGLVYDKSKFETGFYLILKGVFMKAVIANRLSGYVATVFASPTGHNGLALWLAAFFYTIQLYCDFAGYSFMASGATKMLGMHTTFNFNRPYFASNIREFWDRWHISLSDWLKDYVYIPLGGNRCSALRQKVNVILTFIVSGLWHGSGLNYIVWSLYHGLINIFTPKKMKVVGHKKLLFVFLNFVLVMFGWIVFGTTSLRTAFSYFKLMLVDLSISAASIQRAVLPFTGDNTCVAFFLTVLFFIFILFIRESYEEKHKLSALHPSGSAWQVFLLLSILLFGSFGTSGFMYANF